MGVSDGRGDAIDNLAWDDWSTVACAIENGADCVACEG